MKGYCTNIKKSTTENDNFRRVLYTTKGLQLVLMSLLPGEDIGEEIHHENDQFFRFEAGEGRVLIDETWYEIKDGDAVVVPAGANHNVINNSDSEPLRFYTIYTPAHHKDQIVRKTRAEAEENDEDFDGVTTE